MQKSDLGARIPETRKCANTVHFMIDVKLMITKAYMLCAVKLKGVTTMSEMYVKKEELRTLVYQSDVHTLLQDGLLKVSKGLTTFEEIIRLIELDAEDIVIEKIDNSENTENQTQQQVQNG